MNNMLAGRTEVDIDDRANTVGGVFVAWHPGPRVQECTIRAVRLRLLDDRLLEHSGQIAAAMMQAMATILASAGFTVEDADNEYRPYHLRAVEAPTEPGMSYRSGPCPASQNCSWSPSWSAAPSLDWFGIAAAVGLRPQLHKVVFRGWTVVAP